MLWRKDIRVNVFRDIGSGFTKYSFTPPSLYAVEKLPGYERRKVYSTIYLLRELVSLLSVRIKIEMIPEKNKQVFPTAGFSMAYHAR